jgi:nicotinate-nucleotide adenylyltransferase
MRVGFFGGSFDPPHAGHLTVARAAADAFALDRVLLAPAGIQPLKPHGATASFEDRLAMSSLLAREDPRLVASDIDAPRQNTSNYTVDTLTRLRSTLEQDDKLFAIAGADAFASLPAWRNPARLLDLAEWIVVSRPGFETAQTVDTVLKQLKCETARPHVHLLDDVRVPTSATAVREALPTGPPADEALTAPVCDYIAAHHLYNQPPTLG